MGAAWHETGPLSGDDFMSKAWRLPRFSSGMMMRHHREQIARGAFAKPCAAPGTTEGNGRLTPLAAVGSNDRFAGRCREGRLPRKGRVRRSAPGASRHYARQVRPGRSGRVRRSDLCGENTAEAGLPPRNWSCSPPLRGKTQRRKRPPSLRTGARFVDQALHWCPRFWFRLGLLDVWGKRTCPRSLNSTRARPLSSA